MAWFGRLPAPAAEFQIVRWLHHTCLGSRPMKLPMNPRSPGTLAAEMVVIVVGILIALAVDAWWQQHQDRRAERETLAAVYAEFQENDARYREAIRTHDEIVQAVVAVLAASPDDCGEQVAESLGLAVYRWQTFDAASGETDLLIASGRLALIQDADLRRRLASWNSLVSDLVEDEVRAVARRDAIVDFIAMNTPTRSLQFSALECRSLLADARFRYLLQVRLVAEREPLSEENRRVERAIVAILDATS